MNREFSPIRFVIFTVLGLPPGFVLTALGRAFYEAPISARHIFPWALGLAVAVGITMGFSRHSRQATSGRGAAGQTELDGDV